MSCPISARASARAGDGEEQIGLCIQVLVRVRQLRGVNAFRSCPLTLELSFRLFRGRRIDRRWCTRRNTEGSPIICVRFVAEGACRYSRVRTPASHPPTLQKV